MTAQKIWFGARGEELYQVLKDTLPPEMVDALHLDLFRGRTSVYIEAFPTREILERVNERLFDEFNLDWDEWELVYKVLWPGEEWRVFHPADTNNLPGTCICFGWRFKGNLSGGIRSNVQDDETTAGGKNKGDPEKPAFLRKKMD